MLHLHLAEKAQQSICNVNNKPSTRPKGPEQPNQLTFFMKMNNRYWHFLARWRCETCQGGVERVELALHLNRGRHGRRDCRAQTVSLQKCQLGWRMRAEGLREEWKRGREGGRRRGANICWCAFPLNCPSMQCESVLPLQMFFMTVNFILLTEISYFKTARRKILHEMNYFTLQSCTKARKRSLPLTVVFS